MLDYLGPKCGSRVAQQTASDLQAYGSMFCNLSGHIAAIVPVWKRLIIRRAMGTVAEGHSFYALKWVRMSFYLWQLPDCVEEIGH